MKRKLLLGLIPVILIISTITGFYFFKKNGGDTNNFEVVRKDIVESISVSGKIVPQKQADLSFEIAGRIVWTGVSVGDRVYAGQVLAKISDSEIIARINKSELEAEAKLAEKEKSELMLKNYKRGSSDVVNDAYTKAYDAVRQQMEEFFTDDETLSPKLTFLTTDSQTETEIKTKRFLATEVLNKWLPIINKGDLSDAKYRLEIIRNLIDLVYKAVNESINLNQITIIAYKNKLNAARTSINSAITSINDLEDDIAVQEKIVSQQQAALASALAAVGEIKSQLAKHYIYAPFAGIISSQETRVGEISSPNVKAINIISDTGLEIEAYIPEFYIGKAQVGQSAIVTLDAFPDKNINARIKFIEPSETVIEGVPNFKTIFSLENYDFPIKSGMTASIAIETNRIKNAVVVPKTFLVKEGENYFVNKISDKEIQLAPVKIGFMSSSGEVEIISGLSSGDLIMKK